ncbi:carbohydrate ABC transporter permease [Paenibacillus donghaensis]|uniref:Spermidine/putrescine ABC transporter permease n=1 Tax=Paenibacillus donghaensis TaxID=414771 RepID=A0A2Z2KJE0_9BACL|nr:sugar ABC transporter permease [Paenibacillus donghaensis]ASA22429.1 spermidine/putrescine ABC transporter permease [Paenibacillus donghaensis]
MNVTTDLANSRETVRRSGSRQRAAKELCYGLLFASPVLAGYLLLVLVPIAASIYLSFTSYSVGTVPEWLGIANYKNLFSGADPFFYPAVRATFYYVFVSVPLGIILSFFAALLLNQKIVGRSFFRGIFYLPVIIPLAASSMVWMWLLQPDFGIVNYLLELLHLPTSQWLGDTTSVVPTLILFSFWTLGNTIVIFLAGLQGIPRHLYEAIEIDGGSGFHKLIYITIPMSSSIIFFNTVIAFINGFQVFVQPSVMTQGGPNNRSLFYVLYLFNEGFKSSRMGSASAIAVLLFLVIALFTAMIFFFSKSLVYYEGKGEQR